MRRRLPLKPRLFALDHNFPEPLVDALAPYLAPFVELVPVRRVDPSWARLDDWELFWALHEHERPWDGLITSDRAMLSLPKEMTALDQTKLTLVVAEGQGHNPIRATGLVLTNIEHVCSLTRTTDGQVWLLSTRQKDPDAPVVYLDRIAKRTETDVAALLAAHRVKGRR